MTEEKVANASAPPRVGLCTCLNPRSTEHGQLIEFQNEQIFLDVLHYLQFRFCTARFKR